MHDPTRGPSDGADLGARLRAIAEWGDPGEVPDPADLRASTVDLPPRRAGRSLRLWVPLTAAAAAAVAVVVGTIAVMAPEDDRIDVTAPDDGETDVEGGSDFASAIDASGVLTSPSADEVEQATDGDLYKADTGPTEVSAAGHYVSLRCQQSLRDATACSPGWAYITGRVDGSDAEHGGLLDLAGEVSLHLVDDRYFVAVSKGASDAQAPAWLIDAVSGKAGPLSWSDEPTTLTTHEQALVLLCQQPNECLIADAPDEGLPRVVDARDGTIRPMAMPGDVAAEFPVAQLSATRVWVATRPEGGPLGLAYSDDGGATWTEVTLPPRLRSRSEDVLIAADGDRVAVTSNWVPDAMPVYVSEDAGRRWTPATPPSDPRGANIAHLYVLADGRLVLMWSVDAHPHLVLGSTGSDWAELEEVDSLFGPEGPLALAPLGGVDFSVNRAGIAVITSSIPPCSTPESFCTGATATRYTFEFSNDLTTWSTIEGLDD